MTCGGVFWTATPPAGAAWLGPQRRLQAIQGDDANGACKGLFSGARQGSTLPRQRRELGLDDLEVVQDHLALDLFHLGLGLDMDHTEGLVTLSGRLYGDGGAQAQ